MCKKILLAGAIFIISGLSSTGAIAQNKPNSLPKDMHVNHGNHGASSHAPIGVMGDHVHSAGEWMLSYRFMRMEMEGNRNGTNKLNHSNILAMPNLFSGTAGQPASLRIVPEDMTMDMHMLGAMYAPTSQLTLMAMLPYTEKEMNHLTYNPAGAAIIGGFKTKSEGIGDTKISSLISLYKSNNHSLHLNAGVSLPTGSIKERGNALIPNGATPNIRLPYAMQLGTGSFDFHPGVTYAGHKGKWGWGSQYTGEMRLENTNREGYLWGDKHKITAWGSYEWQDWVSTSMRLTATTEDTIKGIDSAIIGPVQTADPSNYGGETINLNFGVNLLGTKGTAKGHRLLIEAGVPLYRNLNGPQLETDYTFMLGWQKAF